mgnify:CR=1 FL=1
MPYIYSNHGLSIRWEDESYTVKNGETASDVFIGPHEPSVAQSVEQSVLLPSAPAPSWEMRLALLEAQLEQFLKISTGITATTAQQ